jgi:hypothetical protein
VRATAAVRGVMTPEGAVGATGGSAVEVKAAGAVGVTSEVKAATDVPVNLTPAAAIRGQAFPGPVTIEVVNLDLTSLNLPSEQMERVSSAAGQPGLEPKRLPRR